MEKPSLDTAKAGAMRFNTDSSQMEIYDGNQWTGILATSGEQQTGGTRGVVAGGYTGSATVSDMDFMNIDSTGDAIDFGDTSGNQYYAAGFGSRTHGFTAGKAPTANNIERWVFASTGTSADYSDLSQNRQESGASSNSTRGVIFGGMRSDIEYITMSSTATGVNFGNLSTIIQTRYANGCGSSTRGLHYIGYSHTNSAESNIIEYVTISTLGNASDFGDYSGGQGDGPMSCSNAVRSVRASGGFPAGSNIIDFVAISTLGNSVDFGDLTLTRYSGEGLASPTRAVFAGGAAHPSYYDVIDFVQFATTGNAFDFGDLANSDRNYLSGATNGHGGL